MLNINKIRNHFPSLEIKNSKDEKIIYLDGPGGTQVPNSVINAISNYYISSNANTHGSFITSNRTDKIMDETRKNLSIFLGAKNKNSISIGHNMTTLSFSLVRAFSKIFKKNDEIIVTQLDHEANRGPWMSLKNYGIKINEIKLLKSGKLDYRDFESKINDKTRLVALGMSSNALGTINDFKKIGNILKNHKSFFLLDAVHYAPHFLIDVKDINCDFLLCSSYKFYGPHLGFLYSKPGILDNLNTDRLIVQDQKTPYRIETGTLNHEGIVGASAAVEFLSKMVGTDGSRRERLTDVFEVLHERNQRLVNLLWKGLNEQGHVQLYGPGPEQLRTPTIGFTIQGMDSADVAERLANGSALFLSHGDFYASGVTEALGIEHQGLVRAGCACYTNQEEVERLIAGVADLCN